MHATENAHAAVDTRNISADRESINITLNTNRGSAMDIQARLDSVFDATESYSSKKIIAFYNEVLRRFANVLDSVGAAESKFQTRIQQALISHEDTLSVLRIGERHFLVADDSIVEYNFNDLKLQDEEVSQLESSIAQLSNIAEDVQQQVEHTDTILIDATDEQHMQFDEYETSSTNSDASHFRRLNAIYALKLEHKKRQQKYKMQRNIAVFIAVLVAIGLFTLSVLYLVQGKR